MKNINNWNKRDWGLAFMLVGIVLIFVGIGIAGIPMSTIGVEGLSVALKDHPPMSSSALFGGIALIIIGAYLKFKR